MNMVGWLIRKPGEIYGMQLRLINPGIRARLSPLCRAIGTSEPPCGDQSRYMDRSQAEGLLILEV